jgi:putative FmdB family regulatory protein
MPLYEYECDTCGRFEILHKFSDPPTTICPTCSRPVRKLLSAPAIQFKGTGWYVTDYGRKGGGGGGGESSSSSKSDKSEKSDKAESSKSESGKSESGKSESGKSESSKADSGKPGGKGDAKSS